MVGAFDQHNIKYFSYTNISESSRLSTIHISKDINIQSKYNNVCMVTQKSKYHAS